MKDLISKLASHLKEEDSTLSEMIKAAESLNRAVKAENVEEVGIHTSEFDSLSSVMEQAEAKREEICKRISSELDSDTEPVNLGKIISKADKEDADRLSGLRKSLKAKSRELRNLSKTNRIMLEANLNIIQSNFRELYSEAGKSSGYGAQGTGKTTFLNTRA